MVMVRKHCVMFAPMPLVCDMLMDSTSVWVK